MKVYKLGECIHVAKGPDNLAARSGAPFAELLSRPNFDILDKLEWIANKSGG